MERDFRTAYGPWAAVVGAGRGIGLAFAREIAARGIHVLLVDVDEDLLRGARDALRDAPGVEVRTARIDLGRADAGAALAAAADDLEVGLAVYCAVRSVIGPFLEQPLERHLESVSVNCAGAVTTCHVLGGPMRRRGRGGIVLLSSLAGFQGTGWVAGYAATKAFDLVLAESLAWELGPHGVDVLALVAGPTDTPGFRQHRPRVGAGTLQAPEEVAAEGLERLGSQSLWISGAVNRRAFETLRTLAREEVVRIMSEGTRRLYQD